jgi:hypothetical protein
MRTLRLSKQALFSITEELSFTGTGSFRGQTEDHPGHLAEIVGGRGHEAENLACMTETLNK